MVLVGVYLNNGDMLGVALFQAPPILRDQTYTRTHISDVHNLPYFILHVAYTEYIIESGF